MALPPVPKYEPVPAVESSPIPAFHALTANVMTLWKYLQTMRNSFTNAAGEAMDPTNGGAGGGGSIDILTPPSDIVFTPGVETNAANQTAEAFIDIAFTLPAHAVGVEVFWREQSGATDKQSYANGSPYRLQYLQPGVTYTLSLAGEAANGALGPSSPPQDVTIPTGASNTAPADAHYVVTALNARLTVEHVLSVEPALTLDNSPGTAKLDIADGGVTTAKLADAAVTDPKLRPGAALSVIGRAANSAGPVADIVAGGGLGHFLTSNGTVVAWEGAPVLLVLPVLGFNVVLNVNCYAARYGRLATFVIHSLTGTGDASSPYLTITDMPALYWPDQYLQHNFPILTQDGSTFQWGRLIHQVALDGTWIVTGNPAGLAFTPSAARGFFGISITYVTNP